MVRLERHDGLDRDRYRRVVFHRDALQIAPALLRAVDERRAAMLRHLESGAPAYGVTTGLGYLTRRSIPSEERLALQRSILLGPFRRRGPVLSR